MLDSYSYACSAVICGLRLCALGRNGGYKNFGSFLTYRGDNSTSKYQSNKKISGVKMFTRWIHKNNKSRPDKRCKSYQSQAKKNGASKRKKK